MSIELARRLIGSGAPTSAIDTALAEEIESEVPFVRVLIERFPELTAHLERELSRVDVPEIHVVKASPELAALLPPRICERLLAVPVFRDPESGRVDVAAVLRATAPAVFQALDTLRARQSSPPIPLVKLGKPPPPARGKSREPEPVLNLSRSKVAHRPAFAFESSIESAITQLARATTPETVASSLVAGLEPARTLVLASRGGVFELRAAGRGFGPELPAFGIAVGASSVFDSAVRSGHYFGALPATLVHAGLRALLDDGPAPEVYAAPVLVRGRPALAVLLSRMGPALEATRRADRLIAAAGDTLERILLARKRR